MRRFDFIDQIAQLLRDAGMAEPRLMSRRLHGNGQEFLVVAFQVALEQRDDVAGCAHKFSNLLTDKVDFRRTPKQRPIAKMDSSPNRQSSREYGSYDFASLAHVPHRS